MGSKSCVFCEIVSGKRKADVVYEDSRVLAILDKNSFSEGHTVILTKKHYENLMDIDPADLKQVILVAKKLALFYKKELRCDGFNILHASSAIAGQSVMHFHMHLVPRYKSDNLGNLWYRPRDKCINNFLVRGRLLTSKYYK
ncbi:MAG: HIT family protein, partial [Candidatus Micrarchaeia archaeon]